MPPHAWRTGAATAHSAPHANPDRDVLLRHAAVQCHTRTRSTAGVAAARSRDADGTVRLQRHPLLGWSPGRRSCCVAGRARQSQLRRNRVLRRVSCRTAIGLGGSRRRGEDHVHAGDRGGVAGAVRASGRCDCHGGNRRPLPLAVPALGPDGRHGLLRSAGPLVRSANPFVAAWKHPPSPARDRSRCPRRGTCPCRVATPPRSGCVDTPSPAS